MRAHTWSLDAAAGCGCDCWPGRELSCYIENIRFPECPLEFVFGLICAIGCQVVLKSELVLNTTSALLVVIGMSRLLDDSLTQALLGKLHREEKPILGRRPRVHQERARQEKDSKMSCFIDNIMRNGFSD